MHAVGELVLISYEFPFGKGETFLESELPVLAKSFSRIWVIPSRVAWQGSRFAAVNSPGRRLPENCRVVLLKTGVKSAVRFGVMNAWRLLRAADFEHCPLGESIRQIRTTLREALKTIVLADGLHLWFSTTGVRSLVYSYWKSEAATALALLQQRGDVDVFISRCHGGDLYHQIDRRIFRPFDRFVFEKCDLLAPVSRHACHYLLGKGVEPEKVHLARLGVRIDRVVCRSSADGILRIVSCSNAIPLKRLDLLASALAMLDVPFEWLHFGDGPELGKVKYLVKALSESQSAEFRGRVPNSVVLDHYRTHPVDVFVNVSSSEGVPVSVMEALSAGVPCIVTDVGGSSEIVDDTCGRVLACAVTSEELAEHIGSVAVRREEWLKRRVGARCKGATFCSAEKNYTEFSHYLQSRMVAWMTAR